MKSSDIMKPVKMKFLVLRGEEILKREEINVFVVDDADRILMTRGYRYRLKSVYGSDAEIFESCEWLSMACSSSEVDDLFQSDSSFDEDIEEDSYVRDLSDNSVSGVYIEKPRDYCLECGSDYVLISDNSYGCPCCDED